MRARTTWIGGLIWLLQPQQAGGDYLEGIVHESGRDRWVMQVFGKKLDLYPGDLTGVVPVPGEKLAVTAEQSGERWEVRSATPITTPAINQTIEGRLKHYHDREIEVEVAGETLKAKTDWLAKREAVEESDRVRVTAAPIYEFGSSHDLDPILPDYPEDWRAFAVEPSASGGGAGAQP